MLAEYLGTMILVAAVVGSGIMATTLTDDVGVQLLMNMLATVLVLGLLIWTLGPISGAHFNPAVTGVALVRREIPGREGAAYIPAQIGGAITGAILANLMFDLPAVSISTHQRGGTGVLLGEVVATAGLLWIIGALTRTGNGRLGPVLVPGLDRLGVLLHLVDLVRQPRGHHRPDVHRHVRRDRPDLGAAVHRRPARRRGDRRRADRAVPPAARGHPRTAGPARPRPRPHLTAPTQPTRSTQEEPMSDKPSVLFVCIHNAGRSQMAAAYLTHLAGDRVEVRSAGSAPGNAVNPAAVAAMLEEGIDMSAEIPKILTDEAVRASDVVITMGCGDTCPIYPGKRYEDWALDDPAGQGVEAVRPIRDDIRRRIEALISEIAPA